MIIEAGQVAVVTGAAQGLGNAVATELVGRGVSVVMADIQRERLEQAAHALATTGAQVLPVVTDVSDATAVNGLAARTLGRFGRVDLVVNNAGIGSGAQALWEISGDEWGRAIGVNLLGAANSIRSFVPRLIEAGRGHIVNVASDAGLSVYAFAGFYCATKHAVVAISEVLREELDSVGATSVGVSVICPALLRTHLSQEFITLAEAVLDPARGAEVAAHLPPGMSAEQLREQFGASFEARLAGAIEPEVAAERILAGVEAGRLHVLTNGDPQDLIRFRAERILAALDAA